MDDTVGNPAQNWLDEISRRAQALRERAATFDPDALENRDVLAIAIGAATALGVLVMGLGPGERVVLTERATRRSVVTRTTKKREKERRKAAKGERGKGRKSAEGQQSEQQRRLTVVEQPMTAVIKNGKLTRRTRRELHKQADQLQKEINRFEKVARAQGVVEQQSGSGNDAREAAAQFGDTVGKRLAAVGAAAATATAPLLERARNSDLPDQVRGGARQLADTTRGRTSDLSDRVREEFVPLIIDRAGKVQERVRDDVVPQVAEGLGRVRDEFLPQVAERLQHVRDDVVPQVAERLQQVRDELAPQAAEVAARAGAQASVLAATSAKAGRKAAKNLASGDAGERISKQTRRGRKQAAARLNALAAQIDPEPRRNTSGLWIFAVLAALGGLLYYIFQDEERRKQVTETAKSVVEQGREIVRDFQGYDEEF